MYHRTEYDRKKLRAYKSFEEYRLFRDGHIEDLKFNSISSTSNCCVVKAKVKPTQKDRTYLNKAAYDLWVLLEKKSGEVMVAYCECQGGSDGACRHIGAVLFDLEALERSVTDGPRQWVRKAREHDRAVQISELKIYKAGYHAPTPVESLGCEYDPRAEWEQLATSKEEVTCFAKKLWEVEPTAAILDFLPRFDESNDRDSEYTALLTRAKSISILKKAEGFKVEITSTRTALTLEEIQVFITNVSVSTEEINLVRDL